MPTMAFIDEKAIWKWKINAALDGWYIHDIIQLRKWGPQLRENWFPMANSCSLRSWSWISIMSVRGLRSKATDIVRAFLGPQQRGLPERLHFGRTANPLIWNIWGGKNAVDGHKKSCFGILYIGPYISLFFTRVLIIFHKIIVVSKNGNARIWHFQA